MTSNEQIKFNQGYHYFHPDQVFNFQLNRWYTGGWGQLDEWFAVGKELKNFENWKPELLKIAKKAETEGRLADAAIYYRAAEFYTYSNDPDKDYLYNKFYELFEMAFGHEGYERFEIPYEAGMLSALKLEAKGKRHGELLLHGGFDSFIEEFYPFVKYFSNAGFDVIMFEGPGQGKPLHKYGLKMTYQWEKPVKTVIDYFELDKVTLIGVSLGGYLAPRAAAFDKRISRVISFNTFYDLYDVWLALMPSIPRLLFRTLFKIRAKSIINFIFNRFRKKNLILDWSIDHGCYTTGALSPYHYYKESQNYSLKDISSKIIQDYLIMAAEDEADGYAPVGMEKQASAAINARSVTTILYTRKELQCWKADHCQVGNIEISFKDIVDWLKKT